MAEAKAPRGRRRRPPAGRPETASRSAEPKSDRAATPGRGPARGRRDRLNQRHAEFVRLYIAGPQHIRGNATRAVIAAGYEPKAARQQATVLLSNPSIQHAIATYHDRADIKAERVLTELRRLALSDMRDYATWGPEGVRLKPSSGLSADAAAAVAEVSEHVVDIPTKDGTITRRTVRFKLHDKGSALRDLARILGLLKDGLRVLQVNQAAITVVKPETLTDEQLAQLEAFLAAIPAPRDLAPQSGGRPG